MTKSGQVIVPGLYIVATPIGNLEDITLRALEVLRRADLIACEDTRMSAKLLSHYGIKARTTSYHDHNEKTKHQELIDEVRAGKIVALISDAGTPLISDPGYTLVKEAAAAGIVIVPIPGVSSVTAAISVSGLPTDRFLFSGFLPVTQGARAKLIEKLASVPVTLVFFESTRRLPESMAALAEGLGDRQATVARELTKMHEELMRGSLKELAAHYAEHGAPKGEAVIVIAPPAKVAFNQEDAKALLQDLLAEMSVKDAATQVAKTTDLPRQELYALALELKGKA